MIKNILYQVISERGPLQHTLQDAEAPTFPLEGEGTESVVRRQSEWFTHIFLVAWQALIYYH